MLSIFSSFLGSRMRSVCCVLGGKAGVLGGRVGLKLELDGTRLDVAIAGFDDVRFRGDGGPVRDGGRWGLMIVVKLLNGGRAF